jgi:hypothetical protein
VEVAYTSTPVSCSIFSEVSNVVIGMLMALKADVPFY